jgi:uncharacterized protein (TIGR03437 family)
MYAKLVGAVWRVFGAAPLSDPTKLAVFIGNAPASVQYAGLVSPGLYQINVVVPKIPDGDQPLLIGIGGLTSQSGVSIAVKN